MADLLTDGNRDEIAAALHRAAEEASGPERALELADELRGLAAALQRVTASPLDRREQPLGTG